MRLFLDTYRNDHYLEREYFLKSVFVVLSALKYALPWNTIQ